VQSGEANVGNPSRQSPVVDRPRIGRCGHPRKCDIGMVKKGNIGPTGKKLPKPDLLLLSYTGCFTFMKWFELLRQEYDCPVAMLHVPYQSDGRIHAGGTLPIAVKYTLTVPAVTGLTALRVDIFPESTNSKAAFKAARGGLSVAWGLAAKCAA